MVRHFNRPPFRSDLTISAAISCANEEFSLTPAGPVPSDGVEGRQIEALAAELEGRFPIIEQARRR